MCESWYEEGVGDKDGRHSLYRMRLNCTYNRIDFFLVCYIRVHDIGFG